MNMLNTNKILFMPKLLHEFEFLKSTKIDHVQNEYIDNLPFFFDFRWFSINLKETIKKSKNLPTIQFTN